ncbi:MAG: hypothetical protein HYU66_27680 [Armatimonadetes bacterium]|nr:hypothetical protein [Armatimonadota bacterium]
MREQPSVGVDFGSGYVLRAVRAGRAFRGLVLWLGCIYLVAIGRVVLVGAAAGSAGPGGAPSDAAAVVAGFALVIGLVFQLCAEVMMLVHTWRLAEALNRVPVLWLLGMFLPLINLIGLLRLSKLAQESMGRVDVKVGLLGPDPRALDELEASAN